MKYKLLPIALFAGMFPAAKAQQLQSSSLYDLQGMTHNASVAGTQENNIIGLSYRNQWSGISGSPKTATVFGSFDVQRFGMGIGAVVYNDKTGPTSRTGASIMLAKHIRGNNGSVFSIGIENRLQQYAIDKAKLSESLGSDPVLGASDNRFKYDAGFGISYTNKYVQVGASVSQLVQSKLDLYSGNLTRTEEARLYRHYYFHGLYNWYVDGATIITPNALVIYLPNAPLTYQVGARVEFNKLFWFGGGYRSHQSFMLSAGVHIGKNFTVGYAYDNYIAPVSQFDNGADAHEVLLRYNFSKK